MPANVLGWRTADYESHSFFHGYTPGTAQRLATTIYGDIMTDTFIATNSDSVDHHLTISGMTGNDPWVTVTLPARAGYDGTPNVDLRAAIYGTVAFAPIWGNAYGPGFPWLALDADPTAGAQVCVAWFGGFL